MTDGFITKVTAGSAWFRRASGAQPGQRTVLALDPGYRVGWAVIELPSKRLVAAGFTELNRKHLFYGAGKMTNELIELFAPCAVLFEQYFIGGGAFAADSIEMRGSMKDKAEAAGLPWANIHLSKIRSLLGLKARRTDALVREAITSLIPDIPAKYQPNSESCRQVFFPADVWDACGVALAADTVEGL